MRALVTGAAGFIGSHLAKRLRAEGHQVTGLDSFTDYYDVGLKRANADSAVKAGVRFVEGDLISADLHTLLDGVDVVFHLAGQPGVRSSWGSEFASYLSSNVAATQRLLEVCKARASVERIVYASSSSVYGNADRYPTSESVRPQPVSPYGVTKLAAEHLCGLYAEAFGVPTVSLRYFTVYGPGQRPDMAFTRFAMAAIKRQPLTIFGTGDQVRDFTFVDDVVEANLLAATGEVTPGTVFNVAGGSRTSINAVLSIFEDLAGYPLMIKRLDAVAGDVSNTGGETSLIRSVLGWAPSVDLNEGISRQYRWARSVVGA